MALLMSGCVKWSSVVRRLMVLASLGETSTEDSKECSPSKSLSVGMY